mgnify:CR=1 FL=1
MADLKQRAKWAKRYRNRNGEWVIELKSLSTATGASLSRLADRIFYIVCTEILPHVKRGKLRKEIEALLAKIELPTTAVISLLVDTDVKQAVAAGADKLEYKVDEYRDLSATLTST